MKPILLISACGLALIGLAACEPATKPTARVALDCPADQGDLKLKTQAPDKKTCDYVSEDGDQVELRLIPVTTTYEAALQPIEQELQAEQTGGPQGATAAVSVKGTDASATVATSEGASAAAKAAKQAADDAQSDARTSARDHDQHDHEDSGDHVSIGTGGVTVGENDGKGDRADINLPGLHITADDDNANVNVGAVHVNAGEDGATVRVARDVRLRGEAFSRERNGFRATYILAKDNLKDGWKAIGYEAAGPKVGPVAVAVFKAHGNHGHEDVKRLVRRNGGI